MRWPWQKREARRTDAPVPSSERSDAPEMVLAPPPSPRAWATLPPLVPAAAPRLATTADVRPAAALATITNLVHRFEPKARDGEGPSGSLLDAARVISRRGAHAEAVIDYTPVELPPMPVRRAPVVEIVVPPEPEPEPVELTPAPQPQRLHTRAQPVSTSDQTVEEAEPEPEPEVIEPPAPAPVVRRNLGQSRRLGLGAPIQRPEPEPEPERVPDDIRSSLQSAYGVDIGDVTIRRDESAATEARELGAAAFAREGTEVVLPADLGATDRPAAKGALAHELTHIAQQRGHGAGLPSEDSDAGRALEAEARAAEQHFRGDAGAPPPRRDDPSLLLTAGVADVGDGGELTFAPPPRPASGVQRLTLQATTPPYRWQQDYLQAEYEGPIEPGEFEPAPADLDEAAAQLERDHLDELVQFRQSQRGQYVDDELESRSGFSAPTPDTEGLSADQIVVAEQKSALEQELRHRTQAVEIQNEAVDEIDAALPLRDSGADTQAVYTSVDSEPDVVRLRDEIASLDATYPDLVHPTAAEGGPPVPQFRTRDLIREAFPGFRTLAASYGLSRPSTSGVTGPTTDTGPSSYSPGYSGGYSAGTSSSTTPSGFTSAPPSVAWESGGYTRGAGEASAFMDWLDDGEPGIEELSDADARQQELAAWPQIRAARNELLRLLIADKVNELRGEAQARGRDVPSEFQATTQITRDEWQLIAEIVEQQVPLEHLVDEQYQLFNDPENDHLRELVALSPTTREDEALGEPGAAGGTAASPTIDTGTASPWGATSTYGAGAAGPAAAYAANEPATGDEPGPGAGSAAAALAAGAAAQDEEGDDDELELSDDQLARLATQLYPRFRSRLRTELLVDRERAGLLTDFR